MTGPQRRPVSLRAFPELGPVMRWPGESDVLADWGAGADKVGRGYLSLGK